jgi:chromate transporter
VRELAFLFLKLGTIAFGGPAAHIAMMEEEVVKRRGWISHEHFLDLLSATNLIPGPNSTELAIHIGYLRAGWRGLVVAGICFILPAVAITLLFAYLYVSYGSIPQVGVFILGIRSAVIAVVLAAVLRLGKPLLKNHFMVLLGGLVAALSLLGIDEIVLLAVAGALGLLWSVRGRLIDGSASLFAISPLLAPMMIGSSTGVALAGSATLTGLAFFFLKVGSVLYGSGYVLAAFLQGGLVDARHWLTQTQLLDAIAVGQFTPGPVLSTATFIGYLILGVPGAVVSTTGIFLPSFVFVLISAPFIPRLRKSPLTRGFLDGVNAASLGLMLSVAMLLGGSTLTTLSSGIVFLLATAALILWNLNPAWIVAGGAVLGWVFSAFAL